MAEHQWEPYTGILTQEPSLSIARQAGLGPHTRTCPVCGVITDDEDDCGDLECTPGRHR
jgi:hypothetical protein